MAVTVAEMSQHDRAKSAAERAAIDASCRGPVLVFASSAVFWLLAGSMLALLASAKLHVPYLFTGSAELTFGRVRMAHLQAVGIEGHGAHRVAGVIDEVAGLNVQGLCAPRQQHLLITGAQVVGRHFAPLGAVG